MRIIYITFLISIYLTICSSDQLYAVDFLVTTEWINPVDDDGDGYPHERTLKTYISGLNTTHNVTVQLSYRVAGNIDWNFYSNTNITFDNFTFLYYPVISGAPFPELPHATYEWKIEVIEPSSSSYTIHYPNDATLETTEQDPFTVIDSRFETILISGTNWSNTVSAFDLDDDGDNDVISNDSYSVIWFENMGGGSFSESNTVMTFGGYAVDLCATDLDGDTDLDLVAVSDTEGEKIKWCENLGSGNFGTENIIEESRQATFVFPFDIDSDGDNDLLSDIRQFGNDTIYWYENDGSGVFGGPILFTTTADNPKQMCTADLDNDGDLDLISASYDDDKIAWYENLGAGSFSGQKIITTNAKSALSVYA